MIDLLIAGGGPAGLLTALHAVDAGLRCLVVEPRSTPIDKACGEGLMPGTVSALRRLGVDVAGAPFRGIRYVAEPIAAKAAETRSPRPATAPPGTPADAPGEAPAERSSATALFRDKPGRGTRRTELHAALARAVGDRGVQIRRGAVRFLRQDAVGVSAAVTSGEGPGECRARYLVGADGLHSAVRRLAGLTGPPGPGSPRRWGLRAHLAMAPWTDLVEVHWSATAAAEAYVTPIDDGCVGIALLGDRRLPFDRQLEDFPTLARRIAGATRGEVLGAGPLRQRATAPRAGRVLLVGDAAGYLDALTGEGIGVALRGARALVDCVAGGRVADYDAAWRAASRRYRMLTGALLAAAIRPRPRRYLVPAAHHLPGVFDAAVRSLAAP